MKSKKQQIGLNQDNYKQNFSKFDQNMILKSEINNLKKPYLTRIQLSKLKVNILKTKSQNQSKKIKKQQQQQQQSLQQIKQTSQKEIINEQQNNKIIRLSSFQQEQIKNNINKNKVIDLPLAQWPGRDKNKIFKNSHIMLQEYQKIFKQKNYSNLKKDNVYSYKKAQNNMLLNIYEEIKDKQSQTVSFNKAQEFLRSHQNFLKVYDLDMNRINDILHFSAQKYQNKLTKLQFLRIFCISYSNQKQGQEQIKYKIQKQCCLDQQNWIELKKIFIQLDTFGDGYIKTKQLFDKMKKLSVSKQLLQSNAIYFPNIKKYYSFKKIMFQLQYKDKLPQILTWKMLQDKIINFQHINYPTIDEISLEQIKKAYIVDDSQSFMIKEQILQILKKQFKQCPKFSNNFVKCKYFCTELLTSDQLKPFLYEYVRADISKAEKVLITLQNNIKMLKKYGSQFIDLDEMLFYFSVKGFQKQLRMKNFQQVNQIESDVQDEFQQKKKLKEKLKRIKSLQKIQKVMKNTQQYTRNLKNKQNKNKIKTTFVEEFNITKKRDHLTIRQQKLKQMVQQKLIKQKSQLKPYVKARTIPASINGQNYLHQKSVFQDKKSKLKIQRQQKRLEDQKKLKYLMTNTKLFNKTTQFQQQKNNKNNIFTQRQNFQAKPIQWYVKQRNLLEIIQNEKEQRRKNKLKQTKEKYIFGYWKNLPYNDKKGQENKQYNQNQSKSDSLQKQLKTNQKLSNNISKNVIKSTPVPDFEKLHKQFTQELQLKKKSRQPTKIIQFNLTSPKKKQNKIQNIQQNSIPLKSKRSQHPIHGNKQLIIGTTRKYQCMVQKNHKRLIQKQQQLYKKYLQQLQRQTKKKIFAKFMKNALKQQRIKNKMNKKNKICKNNNNNIKSIRQKQLNKMYERVLSRPFLFQKVQSSKVIANSFIKQKNKKKLYNNKNEFLKKLIPKIIIPKQNQNQKYLNCVEQLEWEDRDTQREQLNLNNMEVINNNNNNHYNNNNNNKYQQYNQEESQYYDQDQQDQNQNEQQYEQNEQIGNYHNQSF